MRCFWVTSGIKTHTIIIELNQNGNTLLYGGPQNKTVTTTGYSHKACSTYNCECKFAPHNTRTAPNNIWFPCWCCSSLFSLEVYLSHVLLLGMRLKAKLVLTGNAMQVWGQLQRQSLSNCKCQVMLMNIVWKKHCAQCHFKMLTKILVPLYRQLSPYRNRYSRVSKFQKYIANTRIIWDSLSHYGHRRGISWKNSCTECRFIQEKLIFVWRSFYKYENIFNLVKRCLLMKINKVYCLCKVFVDIVSK